MTTFRMLQRKSDTALQMLRTAAAKPTRPKNPLTQGLSSMAKNRLTLVSFFVFFFLTADGGLLSKAVTQLGAEWRRLVIFQTCWLRRVVLYMVW